MRRTRRDPWRCAEPRLLRAQVILMPCHRGWYRRGGDSPEWARRRTVEHQREAFAQADIGDLLGSDSFWRRAASTSTCQYCGRSLLRMMAAARPQGLSTRYSSPIAASASHSSNTLAAKTTSMAASSNGRCSAFPGRNVIAASRRLYRGGRDRVGRSDLHPPRLRSVARSQDAQGWPHRSKWHPFSRTCDPAWRIATPVSTIPAIKISRFIASLPERQLNGSPRVRVNT